MNSIKLVAVFAENKPGQTSRITGILANAHINLRCATLASIGEFGVIKLLVSEPELACQALKHGGIATTLVDALAVDVPDKAGALHAIVDCLAKNGINLDNLSGFVVNNRAVLILEVQNVVTAIDALKKEGLHVLTREETLAL
jgi:hypothetical protein